MRYEEVACASTSARRLATVPARNPAVLIHLSLSCTCKWTECRRAGHRGTSSMDTTYWNTYRPWRPLHRPCTANPYSPCIAAPGTDLRPRGVGINCLVALEGEALRNEYSCILPVHPHNFGTKHVSVSRMDGLHRARGGKSTVLADDRLGAKKVAEASAQGSELGTRRLKRQRARSRQA